MDQRISLVGEGKPAAVEEVRELRLAYLEKRETDATSRGVGEVDDILADTSLGKVKTNEESDNMKVASIKSLEFSFGDSTKISSNFLDVSEFHNLMWDNRVTTENDKDRWVCQGIDIRHDMTPNHISPLPATETLLTRIGSNHLPWGLTQAHGGPCGVLAAVQAELLRILLFSPKELTYPNSIQCVDQEFGIDIEPSRVREGLAMALAIIIARAAFMPGVSSATDSNKQEAKFVLPVDFQHQNYAGLNPDDLSAESKKFVVFSIPLHTNVNVKRQRMCGEEESSPSHDTPQNRIDSMAFLLASFLKDPNVLNSFNKPGGVVLLVMSVIASRSTSVIQGDMDDKNSKLTSQFGHCSQELINLLLTGQAVSNVFDNIMTPSGSLTCYGIQQRPAVGYLTQLESLRYCEVGGYYKNPCFPIWVVGSTSHFTVLFGEQSSLQESQSDELLENCRRAFKSVDGMENGFISRLDLPRVYEVLGLNVGGEHTLQTLAAALEVSGADIILWDDFWKVTSRLMTGASVESVLNGGEIIESSFQHRESDVKQETDEEIARRLANEWGSEGLGDFQASNVAVGIMVTAQESILSDEEFARQLQAQYDNMAGDNDGSTQGATADDLTTSTTDDDEKVPHSTGTVNMIGETIATTSNKSLEFEKFGQAFTLYHYNGLRGGTLTPFHVTRLSAEEAVGASTAMSQFGGPSGAISGGDLEDVVRTKWPSCMVNWLGKSPPYID